MLLYCLVVYCNTLWLLYCIVVSVTHCAVLFKGEENEHTIYCFVATTHTVLYIDCMVAQHT